MSCLKQVLTEKVVQALSSQDSTNLRDTVHRLFGLCSSSWPLSWFKKTDKQKENPQHLLHLSKIPSVDFLPRTSHLRPGTQREGGKNWYYLVLEVTFVWASFSASPLYLKMIFPNHFKIFILLPHKGHFTKNKTELYILSHAWSSSERKQQVQNILIFSPTTQ